MVRKKANNDDEELMENKYWERGTDDGFESILILFEAISGHHINWRRSQLFPVNEVTGLQQLADILSGEMGCFPNSNCVSKRCQKDWLSGNLSTYL